MVTDSRLRGNLAWTALAVILIVGFILAVTRGVGVLSIYVSAFILGGTAYLFWQRLRLGAVVAPLGHSPFRVLFGLAALMFVALAVVSLTARGGLAWATALQNGSMAVFWCAQALSGRSVREHGLAIDVGCCRWRDIVGYSRTPEGFAAQVRWWWFSRFPWSTTVRCPVSSRETVEQLLASNNPASIGRHFRLN